MRCLSNGKRYIGRSADIGVRVMGHIYILRNGTHYNKKLLSDFRKYGEECFSYEVLQDIPSSDVEFTKICEETWMRFLDYKSLYNNRFSTLGAVKGEISEETRNKLSSRQVGEKNHFHGKTHSPETLAKMRESQANRPKVKCPHCDYVGHSTHVKTHMRYNH